MAFGEGDRPGNLINTDSKFITSKSGYLLGYHGVSLRGALNMTLASNGQVAIISKERGLAIAGTRITLYDVMDYRKAQYPPKLIREKLGLNDEQIHAALAYIETHRVEVEAEYEKYLRTAEEIRQYWEDRNRERFAQIAARPPKPGQEALRAKLQAWKARIEAQS